MCLSCCGVGAGHSKVQGISDNEMYNFKRTHTVLFSDLNDLLAGLHVLENGTWRRGSAGRGTVIRQRTNAAHGTATWRRRSP